MQAHLEKVVNAIREFYQHEAFLLEKDLGERTLTHRLAVHLEQEFSGWDVDCDYNRLGERLLKLPHGSIISTDDGLGKSIFPDIVLHRRGIPDNLPALEASTATPKVVKTRADVKADDARGLEEETRITEIPAPRYKEKVRAEYYLKRMQELGFKDAVIDTEATVIALRKGAGGGGPKL